MNEYKKPTWEDALYIIEHMKKSNKQELLYAVGNHALDDMERAFKYSDEIGCFYIDGKPAAIFGVRKASVMSDYGLIWLLMTEETQKHRVTIGRETKTRLKQILRKYTMLYNHVDAKNEEIIKWLKWLGADMKPVNYGIFNLPHYYFEFRRKA